MDKSTIQGWASVAAVAVIGILVSNLAATSGEIDRVRREKSTLLMSMATTTARAQALASKACQTERLPADLVECSAAIPESDEGPGRVARMALEIRAEFMESCTSLHHLVAGCELLLRTSIR